MAVPPAPGLDTGLTSSDPDHRDPDDTSPAAGADPRRPRSWRTALLGVLVAVLLVSTGAVIWLLAERRGEADELQQEREAAMAQARQFMLRGQTYGPDMLDDAGRLTEYRELVEEVVTPKFYTQFEQTATVAEQLVEQTGVDRSAEVLGTGVETIDEDSATVLVAGEISMTTEPAKGEEPSAPTRDLFRVVIEMVKVDGEWLVDDFAQASETGQ